MTNNDLITLLCAHAGWPSPLSDSVIEKSRAYLLANGYLVENPHERTTVTTEKARVYIRALHTVPMPVRNWTIPRQTESHDDD